MRLRYGVILFIFSCFAIAVQAQTVYHIRGYVCSKNSTIRLASVLITNKRSKTALLSDQQGVFAIGALAGDTLEFSKAGFTTAQQVILNSADVVIAMQQTINLSQVNIQGQSTKQELNNAMDGYRRKGVYDNGSPSALSMVASPINGLYELFGKEPERARRFAAYAKQEQEAAADDAKYNKDLVQKITGLPDDEVQKFMNAYTPSHADLQKWTSYDIIVYIKKSLEIYKKYGAPAALPELN